MLAVIPLMGIEIWMSYVAPSQWNIDFWSKPYNLKEPLGDIGF